ncbi:cysteine synthase [Zopfia rhizophila CBS 207.26]|uniref:Cysteine synthase n=1 Tax=Zopfia rhizophila CBS 207.26 TaxID=1314779 RepID=A0A6A6E7C5_9PEZI|nr:cysteine synthase [Zopfia rhizophila CBS 207.26]
MNPANPLNVFKGTDSLAQYFDPDRNPPLPLVELPDALNPRRRDGVRIFAKMLTTLPAQNVKSLPALRMLQNEPEAYRKTIVEASSGSTVLSLGMISRALWDHEDVHAYVTNKKHTDSLRLLRFFGLNVALYGGLAQQEPYDPKGIMSRLRDFAKKDPNVCYPGQYHNDHNWRSHEQWTGAQIWKQLPEINVFCSTIGTGGCAVGTGTFLKSRKPSVKVVGVCNDFGDPTPGPRHFPNFESSPFPWRGTINKFETVSSVDSYRMSMRLSRYGIIAGPSSGEALHGLLKYLQNAKDEGLLSELADQTTGEISCVFICADLPYQYMDMYFKKLDEGDFPPIYNENLLVCDLEPYDERWFLTPDQVAALLLEGGGAPMELFCSTSESCLCAMGALSPASPPSSMYSNVSGASSNVSTVSSASGYTTVIDIRPVDAYASSHLSGAQNIPLPETKEDFLGDSDAVQRRWTELKDVFDEELWLWKDGKDDSACCEMERRPVLVVCTDGDSGRMATAQLRAKGCQAFCIEGGYRALRDYVGRTE